MELVSTNDQMKEDHKFRVKVLYLMMTQFYPLVLLELDSPDGPEILLADSALEQRETRRDALCLDIVSMDADNDPEMLNDPN